MLSIRRSGSEHSFVTFLTLVLFGEFQNSVSVSSIFNEADFCQDIHEVSRNMS
jgi:hypothetical protein